MRKKMILRLSLLIVSLTLLWSCRNEDFVQAEKNPLRNNQDFFKHTKNNDAFARAGIDYVDILEAYNKNKDFLSHIPDQDGMPIWEKMKIVHGVKVTSLMIPLSTDDATMSSIVFALIDNDGNQVKDVNNITNEELKRVVYSESYSTEEKEGLFTTFMMMDNYTFGNEAFTNIPKDLFVGYSKIGEMGNQLNFHAPQVKETDIKEQISENGKLQVVQEYVCAIVNHCTNHGPPPCDGCSACRTQSCSHATIFVYTYPDPNGTGIIYYGYGDEGGGPTTPAVIPGPDPCGLTKAFYRLAPGCNGYEPPEPIENPCEKIKAQRNDSSFNDKINDLKSKTDLRKETGYIERNNGQFTYNENATATDTHNSLGLPNSELPENKDIKGYMHTHVNDFTYFDNDLQMDVTRTGIKIFSPADISYFMEMLTNAMETLTPFDDVYAIMVSSGQTYQIRFTGNQYQIKTFTKQQKINFRTLYIDFMSDKLKKAKTLEFGFLKFLDGAMNVKGVVLYRMNSNGTTTEIKLNATKTDIITTDCPN